MSNPIDNSRPRMPMPEGNSEYEKVYRQKLHDKVSHMGSEASDDTPNDNIGKDDNVSSVDSDEDSIFGDEPEPIQKVEGQGLIVEQQTQLFDRHNVGVQAKQQDQPIRPNAKTLFCGKRLNSTIVVSQYQLSPPSHDDDNNDFMIIEESDIPDHVKQLFASKSKPYETETPDVEIVAVRVKQEPGSPKFAFEKVPENQLVDLSQDLPKSVVPEAAQSDIKTEASSAPATIPVVSNNDDDEQIFVDEHLIPTLIADKNPSPNHPIADHVPVNNNNNNSRETILDNLDNDHANDDGQAGVDIQDLDTVVNGDEIQSDDGNDGEFTVSDDQVLSDGEQPRERRRKRNKKKKSKNQRNADEQNSGNEDDLQDEDDIQDEIERLETEFKLFERRKAKGKIVPREEEVFAGHVLRYQFLTKKLASFGERDTERLVQEELRKITEAEGNEDESADDTTTECSGPYGSANMSQRIPAFVRRSGNGQAGPGPSTQKRKRKWQQSRPAGPSSGAKKQKTVSRTGRGGKRKIVSNTQRILDMVTAEDPIYARARLNEVEVFETIDANTVKEQLKQLKAQTEANPNAARSRILADFRHMEKARRLFGGRKYIRAENGRWWIRGMEKRLHHYQLVGAGWMLQRELHDAGPFGGILADHLGLGKTIEALACIMGNPLPDKDRGQRYATLIVVPPNLQAQWQEEVETCCPSLHIVQYHSSRQYQVRDAQLLKADVIVTSYSEVIKGFPSKEKLKALEGLEVAEKNSRFNAMLGKLFQVEWYRIILDEAHSIKNASTHTFKACNHLQAKYRWALSATPVHNGLHEFYPYYQFIRAKPEMTSKEFRKKIAGKSLDSLERDQNIKRFLGEMIMYRRLDTLFLGKSLFKIPKTHPLPDMVIDLSEEETVIYRRIESIIRGNFNRELASQSKGPERKKALNAFVCLALRLRQAATHPYMLFPMMRNLFEVEDIKIIRQQLSQIKTQNPNRLFIDQVGRYCDTLERTDRGFGQSGFGMTFDMDPQLEKLEKSKSLGATTCNICTENIVAPRKTRCGHVFCRDCLEDLIEEEREQWNTKVHCPTCKQRHDLTGPNGIMIQDGPGGSQAGSRSQSRRRSGGKGMSANRRPDEPGSDANGFQPLGNEHSAVFLHESDRNIALEMTPSAKTARVKDIILGWQKDFPNDKIIVFTQWVMVGRILGRVLQEEGIKFLYYFGEMSMTEKNENIAKFRKPEEDIRVMVASLKCGGQGLNLTCANRVIMVDLWWNSAVEQQAYGRVFRMGQTKETYYVRIMTKNTIDGRMNKLQTRKLKEIQSGFHDHDPNQTFMRLEEVAELFGRTSRDKEGRVVEVMSDYESDDEDDNDNDGGDGGDDEDDGDDGDEPGVDDDNNNDGHIGGAGLDIDLPPGEEELQYIANFNNGYGVQEHIDLTN